MEFNKLIAAIVMIVIASMIGFLLVLPKYKESVSLQADIMQKQIEYDEKSLYYAKILDAVQKIQSKKDSLQKINSALPSDVTLAPLVYFFQKNLADAGLSAKSIVFSKISSADANGMRTIGFIISTSGSYASFKNFLSILDTSARLFELNSISLRVSGVLPTAQQSKNTSQTYDFQLEIETHTY